MTGPSPALSPEPAPAPAPSAGPAPGHGGLSWPSSHTRHSLDSKNTSLGTRSEVYLIFKNAQFPVFPLTLLLVPSQDGRTSLGAPIFLGSWGVFHFFLGRAAKPQVTLVFPTTKKASLSSCLPHMGLSLPSAEPPLSETAIPQHPSAPQDCRDTSHPVVTRPHRVQVLHGEFGAFGMFLPLPLPQRIHLFINKINAA